MQRALIAQGHGPAPVVDYIDLLQDPDRLAEQVALHPHATIKLESPGEAADLHHCLVVRGWELTGQRGPRPQRAQHGELRDQHLWFAGFRDLLERLPSSLRYLNSPESLLQLIDKSECQRRLLDHGVAAPDFYGPVTCHEQLRLKLREVGCRAAFVKARYGSSAAGVLAYRQGPMGEEIVTTSSELCRNRGELRLYNNLRLRRYRDSDDIAALVDAIAGQGAYVERWIAKPRAGPPHMGSFDIRVVALDSNPRHRLARVGKGPMTNLHLGNKRADVTAVLDRSEIRVLERSVASVGAVFPRCRALGIDIIVRGSRYWVVEVNGFGDLLLGQRWLGLGTYEDQAQWLERNPQRDSAPCLH